MAVACGLIHFFVQVKNTRHHEAEIEVSEQFPLSQDDRIKVCAVYIAVGVHVHNMYNNMHVRNTFQFTVVMLSVDLNLVGQDKL